VCHLLEIVLILVANVGVVRRSAPDARRPFLSILMDSLRA